MNFIGLIICDWVTTDYSQIIHIVAANYPRYLVDEDRGLRYITNQNSSSFISHLSSGLSVVSFLDS